MGRICDSLFCSRLFLGLSLLGLAACGGGGDGGSVVVGPTPPVVRSTAAAPDASAVALTVTPMVTFSEAMDGTSLTPSTFTLAAGAVSVGGSVSTQGAITTFRPTAALLPNTRYTATVASGVKTLAGIFLPASHSWSFTTESQTWSGVAQRGTVATDSARAVAVDGSGSVYLAGSTLGGLDGNLNLGGEDLFLVKYDATGVRQWTRQVGSAASDSANAVAVDGAGNVYLAGSTLGVLPGTGNSSAGGEDLILLKYDSSGVLLWSRQFVSVGSDVARGVAVDAGGNVYLAGSTFGTLPGVGNSNAGGEDLFLVKYDGTGALLWTRQLGSVGADRAFAVAVGSSGEIFVAGSTLGALPGNSNVGGSDHFLIAFAADGSRLWIRQFGTVAFDAAQTLATDGVGGIYLGGVTSGSFDGNVNAGGSDLMVAKYDRSGARLWSRQLGSVGSDAVLGLGAEGQGGAYLTGSTSGGLDGNLSSGGEDLVVVKYDGLGNKQWSRQFGTAGTEQGRAVAVDRGGNAFVAGGTTGALPNLLNAGGEDLLLLKYDTSGTRQ